MPASLYAEIAATLTTCLNLRQPPVAIGFADAVPDTIASFAGRVPAGCRFWQDASTETFATSAPDHELCAIGSYTHNLPLSGNAQADMTDALRVLGQLGYVREEDLAQIPVLKFQSQHVIYSPLAKTPLPPGVVLLFVNVSQALILSEATQQIEGLNPPAMGRPACAVVPHVMNTGRAAMSLGCCGARSYLNLLSDDVALFAIPGAKLEAYTERIEVLAKANAVLSNFHQIRKYAVESGQLPPVKESLAALGRTR